MQYRYLYLGLLGLATAVVLGGCGATEGTGDGTIGDGPKTGTDGSGPATCKPPSSPGAPPEGLVTFKKAGESVVLTAQAANEYVIVPYSVSTVAATGIAFDVKITDEGKSDGIGAFRLKWNPPPSLEQRNPALWLRWKKRLAVEAWTRRMAERAAKLPMAPPRFGAPFAGEQCVASKDCKGEKEVCQAGKCIETLTLNVGSFSKTATITAKVLQKGTKAAIIADSANTVSTETAKILLDKFEKIILPRDVALFGDPPLKSGSTMTSSDRNGDGLLWLVLTSKVQEKEAVGFFDATDFVEDDAKSNKADILYIDAEAKPESAYGIMAHELQHLLSYASKVYRLKANGKEGKLEALWLDEGQSHFAEEACGFGGENVTVLREKVFPDFSDTSLFAESNANDTLAMRGMAMTFVHYLFEQKGGVKFNSDGSLTDTCGATWLASLHASEKQGAEAVTATYGDYKTAFDNWIATLTLDGRGVTTYAGYVYKDLVTDSLTGNQIGLKIRGKRKDFKGIEQTLDGFLEEEISGTTDGAIPNGSGKFYKLTGKTGKVTVSVETKESDFRFAVIKVK